MNTVAIRKKIHEYIDHADERSLRLVYSMVRSEEGKTETDFYSTTTEEMITRANSSLKSVEERKTRNIRAFKKEIDEWMKNPAIR
ncbi:MAG: hypothetical protein JW723_13120 [Bacteroidales bacterium]|nr:hypothetical protein [Bacteroidales bacterium]